MEKPEQQNSSAPPPSNALGHFPPPPPPEPFFAGIWCMFRSKRGWARAALGDALGLGEKAGLGGRDSKTQTLCRAQKPERGPGSHREELCLSSWRRPSAPLGCGPACGWGIALEKVTWSPPGVSHGAVGPPTRGSLPSTIWVGKHGARPTSPQPQRLPAGLGWFAEGVAGCSPACLSSPQPSEKPPQIPKKKALTKPLHPCTAAQTPSPSSQVLPEAPKSFQHLPSTSKPCSATFQGFYKEPLPLGSFGPSQ